MSREKEIETSLREIVGLLEDLERTKISYEDEETGRILNQRRSEISGKLLQARVRARRLLAAPSLTSA